jgi:hypothetical protein
VTTAIAGVSGGDVTAASNLTDNCLVRGDGGAKGIQTTGVVVDDSGRMVNTSQPAFLAYINATQSNVSGDGTSWNATGSIWTEVYDQGSNFSNGTFTAPVTGKYAFSFNLHVQDLSSSMVTALLLVTSNANYVINANAPTGLSTTMSFGGAVVNVDMDINDTAFVLLNVSGGTKTADVIGGLSGSSYYSAFAGHLVC